jgi:hypothetical protein
MLKAITVRLPVFGKLQDFPAHGVANALGESDRSDVISRQAKTTKATLRWPLP